MSNLLRKKEKRESKSGLNLPNLLLYNAGNANPSLSTTTTTIANAVVNSTSTSTIPRSDSDTISDIRGINERLMSKSSLNSSSSAGKPSPSNRVFDNFSLDNIITPGNIMV